MFKLFTHTDLDGVGCAILAKLTFKDNVDIEYCDYDNINEKVLDYLLIDDGGSFICITDISINDDVARLLDARGKVQLLDHHPTALNLNKYSWCKVMIEDLSGIKTSGTHMFYHWLGVNSWFSTDLETNDALQRFAELVRNYDTWRWVELGEKGIICKQVNDLLYLYGRDRFITWCISQIHDNVFPKLYAADELVLQIKQMEIDNYIEEKNKQIIFSKICDRKCGIVFAEKYVSELGNRLCLMHPEIDFIAIINMNGTISYRAVKENINLGKDIAQAFGGGGHPKAAGSRFSDEVSLEIIKSIFTK